MRKWQNLAPPDDPGSWYDVDGAWPTGRGSYETADFLSGTEYTATGAATPVYAFTALLNQGAIREYVYDGKMWEYSSSGGTLTDRTGGAVGGVASMAQYGNVTIAAGGGYKSGGVPGNATTYSTGANFAALAGAPQADIVAVQSNIVWYFNLGTGSNNGNGWQTSDVGDYTNYTTGESASGNLIATQGDIFAAVPFGGDMVAFKRNAIYRMRYVGGAVKIASEVAFVGIGCVNRHAACAGATGILFVGSNESVTYKTTSPTLHLYWFDGASPPRIVNTLTALTTAANETAVWINYDPRHDLFSIVCQAGSAPFNRTFFYCPSEDAWGKTDTPITNAQTASALPIMGDFYGRADAEKSPMPVLWNKESANKLKRYSHGTPMGEIASACYWETAKIGKPDRKTKFGRLIPLIRRKVDLGSDSTSLSMSLFRERHDTSAQSTRTVSEASDRHRFDLHNGAATDNFARFKVTYTAIDVELDDLLVDMKDGGE